MEQEAAQRLVAEAAREVRRGASAEGTSGSHVVTLVNAILDTALAEDATDIHLEPMGGRLRGAAAGHGGIGHRHNGGNQPVPSFAAGDVF